MQLVHVRTPLYLVVCVCSLLLPAPISAADKPGMSVVDLLEIPLLSNPELSPDGSQLLFTLAEADWKKNKRLTHIWRQTIGEGKATQLTRGEEGESSPKWSPDGTTIAFLAKRSGDKEAQIYLLPTTGGEASRLTEHDTSPSSIEWSPDGGSLFFVAPEPKTKEEKKRDKTKDDVFAYDENWKHRHLWRVDVETGDKEQLTEGDYSIGSYSVARDGSALVAHRAPSPLLDDRWSSEIFVLDANGGNPLQLTNNTQPEGGAEISPDGTKVLFTADANDAFEGYYNRNLFVVSSAGGEPRLLLEGMAHEVLAAQWSVDGRGIFFVANTGVRSQLFRVDVETEEITQLTFGDHSLRGWSHVPALDTHVASLSTSTNGGDVWRLKEGVLEKLTSIYDHYADDVYLPRQEAITWTGADGTTVEGMLYYPRDFEAGTRYPLAVQTHGGPRASDKFGFPRWSSYVPILTDRGWLVFRPNYRGSTGYGDNFLRDMVGHYFHQAHLDVMTGVDHLIAKGLADGDRMIKMGWSGGGHMTNKIITHTDRFKAASSGAGASNWVSMYGQTDIRIHRGNWFGGSPWREDTDIENYWRSSALSEIWKVKTPTLVLVGQNDRRVPAAQSVELEWFEKHALGREYEWETAPGDDGDEDEGGAAATATASGSAGG